VSERHHQTCHRAGNTFITACVAAFLSLYCFTLGAQPELPVTRLLFEPVPIPA